MELLVAKDIAAGNRSLWQQYLNNLQADLPDGDGAGGPGYSDSDIMRINRNVAHSIMEEQNRQAGDLPGGLLRMAKEVLPPEADPLAELSTCVRHAVDFERGIGLPTYTKPSRRQTGKLRMAAQRAPQRKVGVICDTSGSMGEHDLGKVLGVIQQSLGHATSLIVMSGDVCIETCQKVFDVNAVEFRGGGGTSMRQLMLDAVERVADLQALLVVPDG
jgi:predicted metal-dependent peptidase